MRTQYTLVERDGYHPTAVSKTVLNDMLATKEKILSSECLLYNDRRNLCV